MARILVPSDFGLVAMATTFAAAIDSLSQLGLQEALVRRQEDDDRLHNTAFTMQIGRTMITAVAIMVSAPAASDWFKEPRLTPVLWTLAALSFVSGFRNIGIVAFRREMNYGKQFMLLCVPRLIQVGVTIPLALLLRSYWTLVAGIAVAKLVDLVMSYALHPYRPKLSLIGWRELAAFSMWTWATSIASILWTRCDPFVVGPALGAAQLGIYLLAVEIATLPVTELVAPAAEALFAGFSLAQKHGASPVATALPVATTLLLVIMPVMIAISCTSGYVVAGLLGPNWIGAQPLVAVAAWFGLFSPYSYVCGVALVSANRVQSNFGANCLTSVIKLAALAAAVSVTANLVAITAVSVVIVGLEAGVFIVALVRAGAVRAGEVTGGFFRIIVSTAVTLAIMAATGTPWKPVIMPAWQALPIGGMLACGAVATFVASAFSLWCVAGRPEGPETQVVGLVRHLVGPIAAKVSAAHFMRAKSSRP